MLSEKAANCGDPPASLKPKSLVFRIRKQYFDAIVSGEKKVEYRKDSEYWRKRILNANIAVFICGKRVHRRRILQVQRIKTPDWFSEQGQKDVDTTTCLAFYLGSELKETTGQ